MQALANIFKQRHATRAVCKWVKNDDKYIEKSLQMLNYEQKQHIVNLEEVLSQLDAA